MSQNASSRSLTINWSVAEGLNDFVMSAERPVVISRSVAELSARSPSSCDSSSFKSSGAVDPALPHRTTLTARSDDVLLSDAVVVHSVHAPTDVLNPNRSFTRSRSGRLFANALSVNNRHATDAAAAAAAWLSSASHYYHSICSVMRRNKYKKI